MVHDALVMDLLVTNYEESLLPSWHGLRSKLKVIVAERDRAVARKRRSFGRKEKREITCGSWFLACDWTLVCLLDRRKDQRTPLPAMREPRLSWWLRTAMRLTSLERRVRFGGFFTIGSH